MLSSGYITSAALREIGEAGDVMLQCANLGMLPDMPQYSSWWAGEADDLWVDGLHVDRVQSSPTQWRISRWPWDRPG